MKMKVMYFGFEGFDNPNGTNHLAISLIDEMLKENIEVYLLNSHTKGIDPDIPFVLLNRENFNYDIINRKEVDKNNFIQRYVNGVIYAFKAMKYWMKRKKELDIVILQSTPTIIFSIVLLKLFLKKPIIYSLYDVFPENGIAVGAIKKGIISSVLKNIQKVVYWCADTIVVISEDMKKQMISLGIDSKKIEIVPLWYDDSYVSKKTFENNYFIQKYDININKFIVQYAGNFGYTFDYKMIIKVAEILQYKQDIQFHMIGNGAFLDEFSKMVEEKNLKNIKFFPWQQLSVIYDVYRSCDIAIIPLENEVIKNAYPSKTSLIMACGKSFICTTEKESVFYKNINEKNIAICIDRNKPWEVADKIITLSNSKEKLAILNLNAEKYARKYLSKKYNTHHFIKIIKHLGD